MAFCKQAVYVLLKTRRIALQVRQLLAGKLKGSLRGLVNGFRPVVPFLAVALAGFVHLFRAGSGQSAEERLLRKQRGEYLAKGDNIAALRSERAGKVGQPGQAPFQFIDQIGRKLGRVLEHILVLLDILLHHGDLLACLLNSLLVLFDGVGQLFHIGNAVQQLDKVGAAIGAGDSDGVCRCGAYPQNQRREKNIFFHVGSLMLCHAAFA